MKAGKLSLNLKMLNEKMCLILFGKKIKIKSDPVKEYSCVERESFAAPFPKANLGAPWAISGKS